MHTDVLSNKCSLRIILAMFGAISGVEFPGATLASLGRRRQLTHG